MSVGQTTRQEARDQQAAAQQATRPQAARQQGRLPVEATGFIGRQAELARLGRLLERARLVTVTGPGGVGKTRVALRAAALAGAALPGGGPTGACFADGVCLVELSGLREPALLAQAVADALGLPGRAPERAREAVLAHLRDRQLLLILDTCEHLIDDCAMFAEAVIVEAPGITLLATSREPLDVIGENSFPIPPLPIPAADEPAAGTAVDLFLQRAAAAVPGFTLAPGDMRHAIRLCQRLDGLPLAIELAAVRLRALSLAELASRLDERLVLLAGGQRGGRHKTLRDAIAWSYDLCTPAERALWARLSVFSGPVSIGAAEEVCAGGEVSRDQVMTTMIRLVDKSVLGRPEPDDSGGLSGENARNAGNGNGGQPARYQMLDTIREFGAERLAAKGDESATRGRLVARYLRLARGLQDLGTGNDQPGRLRELRREYASVEAALSRALGPDRGGEAPGQSVAEGVELAIVLAGYWRALGRPADGRRWLSRAIDHAPAGSAARARALIGRGYFAAGPGDAESADADAAEALSIGRERGDEAIIARARLVQTRTASLTGRLAEAAAAGAVAGRLLKALEANADLIELEIQLAHLALRGRDAETATGHVRRGLGLLSPEPEQWRHGDLYLLAAQALLLAGRETEAAAVTQRALRVKDDLGDSAGIAVALEILGWLASQGGQHERAAWLLGAAEPLREQADGGLSADGSTEHLRGEAAARSAAALGGKRFETLFARAARQRTDQVVAFAAGDADESADDGGPASRLPGQLTAREHEIALLVAHGLSNRQIAGQLFISRRTVDAHVEHIFAKLGITSRVTLAIRLREHPGTAQPSATG